jgi:hypothetical protein
MKRLLLILLTVALIMATALGAHAVPAEWTRHAKNVEDLTDHTIPRANINVRSIFANPATAYSAAVRNSCNVESGLSLYELGGLICACEGP